MLTLLLTQQKKQILLNKTGKRKKIVVCVTTNPIMQKLGEGDHNSTVQYTTTSIFDDSFVEAKQLLPSNLLEEKNENHKRIII